MTGKLNPTAPPDLSASGQGGQAVMVWQVRRKVVHLNIF